MTHGVISAASGSWGLNDFNASAKEIDLEVIVPTATCSTKCWQERATGRSLQVPFSDLVAAYSVLASGGQYKKPTYILSISNNLGNTLYENRHQATTALSKKTVERLNRSLQISNLKPYQLRSEKDLVLLQTNIGDQPDSYTIGYGSGIVFGLYLGRDTPTTEEIKTEAGMQEKIIANFQNGVIKPLLEEAKKKTD